MEQKTLQELVHADARTDGKGVVPDYGDEKAEYDVLIEGCGLVDRSARGKLEVTGEDRARFLHGMLTNAVETLAEGEGNHSALTDPKGSTQADLYLYHRGDAFWAETEPELQVKVADLLDRYLIADDVEIRDVSTDWSLLGLQGPSAESILGALGIAAPPEPLGSEAANVAGVDGWVVRRAYASDLGFDVWVPASEVFGVWAAAADAGAVPVGFTAVELRRIERGHPRYGQDVDDRVVPLEAGMADTLSFTKGCFIGQETLAKMQNLGKPRRFLVGLSIEGDHPPEARTSLYAGDKEVGDTRSSAASPALGSTIALGSVRRGSEEPGTELRLGDEGAAVVVSLPFAP